MAHISLVTLGVRDVESASHFYERLGWRRSSTSVTGTVAFLAGGSVALALYGARDLVQDAGLAAEPGLESSELPPPRMALAMNLTDESAVDEALSQAESAGARITKPATKADWGGYSGYFVDPDGHLWEVAHNPGFPLESDGSVQLP